MKDIREKAEKYWVLAAMRAVAHENSAEWHRGRGVRLGVIATGLSAVVGSAVFVAVAKQLGPGEGTSLPTGALAGLFFYFVLGLLLVSAPVLTGIHTYLNHPQQAERHKASSAD